jgi:hypothetical protein
MLQSAWPSAERERDPVIRSWSGETWLELAPTSDPERGQPIDPARWREEGKYEGENSEGRPWYSAFSGGVHWEDGPNGLLRHSADPLRGDLLHRGSSIRSGTRGGRS